MTGDGDAEGLGVTAGRNGVAAGVGAGGAAVGTGVVVGEVGVGVDAVGVDAGGVDAVGTAAGSTITVPGSVDPGVALETGVAETFGTTGGDATRPDAAEGPGTTARRPSMPPAFPRSAVAVRATARRPASAMPLNSPPRGEIHSSQRLLDLSRLWSDISGR